METINVIKRAVIAGLTRNPLKIIAALVVTCAVAQAQNVSREMTLEKDYVPSIKDANKINSVPDVIAPTAPQTDVRFAKYLSAVEVPSSLYPLQSLVSAFGSSDQIGYITLGGSALPDFFADAAVQPLHSFANQLNIFASHHSGNYKVSFLQDNKEGKKKINDNVLGVNYLHNFNTWKILTDAQYTYSQYNDYGQLPVTSYQLPVADWKDNLFAAHLGAASTDLDVPAFKFDVGYTRFGQNYGAPAAKSENRLLLDADMSAPLSIDKRIGIKGYAKNYGNADTNNADTDMDSKSNYTTLSVSPYMLFEGANWETHLGLSVGKQFGDRSKFLLAPDVRFYVNATDHLQLYASATGGFRDNSNYELYQQNRYIAPSVLRITDSRTSLNAKLGTNFAITRSLNVDLHAGYRITDDEWFLVNDYANIPVSADAKVLNVGGRMRYKHSDVADIELSADYNNWDVTDLQSFNKPKFDGHLNIGIKPVEPLRFDLLYRFELGRPELDDIHDVSLRGTFSFAKHFSAFAAINNLLFQKYELWYGYPANPFNVMGGLTYRF
ncbi:hypothetical protein AGMMS49982_20600 [Bacteroidia bacterium]|nr:hypothetical protein AGMMS49982_20600 [Bacteroidia bacterium]